MRRAANPLVVAAFVDGVGPSADEIERREARSIGQLFADYCASVAVVDAKVATLFSALHEEVTSTDTDSDIGAKRLGLLRELVPKGTKIGFLSNPGFPTAETQLNDLQEGARALGVEIEILRASTASEIDLAFDTISQDRPAGLVVAADPFFDTRRNQLVVLTARHALPAMYHLREYAAAGGLISYGIDLVDVYRQLGIYAAKILGGANPADLPVQQPTKFELIINLQTAKTLGLRVPQSLLIAADEMIE